MADAQLYTRDPAFIMSDNYDSDDAMNRPSPLSPREVHITPRPVPVGRDYLVLPPIQAPRRSLPALEQMRILPSIPSLQSPQSLCAATSESGSNNSRVLPPIRSILAKSLPNVFPLYPYPDRRIPQFLPQQVSPGPFSHLSSVGIENASKELFPARTAAFSPPYVMSYATPISPLYPNQTHHERTAMPFQPQSLDDRHANVHSQDRLYRCPIETCLYYGKGFERNDDKNRHFRTHQSPSYCCPSCGNMYARSDTLRRHVRDQHHGKNKNDPRLRQADKRCHSKAVAAQGIDIR